MKHREDTRRHTCALGGADHGPAHTAAPATTRKAARRWPRFAGALAASCLIFGTSDCNFLAIPLMAGPGDTLMAVDALVELGRVPD